jgi:hypothetical protein
MSAFGRVTTASGLGMGLPQHFPLRIPTVCLEHNMKAWVSF